MRHGPRSPEARPRRDGARHRPPCRRRSMAWLRPHSPERRESMARRRSNSPKGDHHAVQGRSKRILRPPCKASAPFQAIRAPRGSVRWHKRALGSALGRAWRCFGTIRSPRGNARATLRAIGACRVWASVVNRAIRSPPCSARSMFLSKNARLQGVRVRIRIAIRVDIGVASRPGVLVRRGVRTRIIGRQMGFVLRRAATSNEQQA